MTINAYLLYKNPIKTILKMSYNTYTGVDTALKEVSKKIFQLSCLFGAASNVTHSHPFCAFLSPCLVNA